MAISKSFIEKQRESVEAVRKEEAVQNVTANNVMSDDTILEEFNLADMKQVDIRHKNMSSVEKGVGPLTIINHDRCGRRIHLSNVVWRELGCPRYFKIFLKPKQMFVIGDDESGIAVKFERKIDFEEAVKNYNGKVVLYATETVKNLTVDWQLEFDSSCCYTGGYYKKCLVSGKEAILISKYKTETVAIATKANDTVNTDENVVEKQN